MKGCEPVPCPDFEEIILEVSKAWAVGRPEPADGADLFAFRDQSHPDCVITSEHPAHQMLRLPGERCHGWPKSWPW